MEALFWLLVLVATPVALAYRRTDLKTSTAVLGAVLLAYTFLGDGWFVKLALWIAFAALALMNAESLRRDLLTRRMLAIYRGMLPRMSKTEQEALEAGNVWWEGEL